MSFSAVSAADEIEVADLAGNRRLGQSQHESRMNLGTIAITPTATRQCTVHVF
jgi:hypothetical protein